MNEAQFDRLTRLIGRATTRRQILGGAAGLGGATLLTAGGRRVVSAQPEPTTPVFAEVGRLWRSHQSCTVPMDAWM
jgi:hypothetical protein